MQVFGVLQIHVLAFFLVLLNPRISFAQNSSNQLSFSPAPSVFADLEEDISPVMRSAKAPSTINHNEALPYTYRPPQAPLDVKGYPVAPQDLKLEQVHIYVRHGERTPVGIRLAPFIPEHWIMCKTGRRFRSPVSGNMNDVEATLRTRRVVERKDGSATEGLCLLGELTDIGRKSTLNYGTALRNLYIDRLGFLPDLLQLEEVYFRSTNMPRTIESLEQVIHGLYPTSKCPNALPTLLVRNGRDENLLGNTMSCKRLEYLQIGFAQAAAAAYNQTLEPLDKHVSKYLDGRPIRIDGRPRASGVLDTIRAAIAHGVKVPPEFEDKAVVDVIEQAVVAEWFAGYKTHEVRRLGMGPLLSDLANKMAKKAQLGAENPLKIMVHSTHDTALAAMLSTLDVFDDKWPAFAAHISFELFKKSQPDYKRSYLQTILSPFTGTAPPEYFVRMRYQNKNMALPVCAEEGKHLPGSPEFCTLAAFRERVKELTPVDWDTECASTGWS